MEDIKIINWLKDSKYRINILRYLTIQPHLPSELAKKLDTNRSSISRILKGLKKKDLIKGISEESRTISYILTDKGKDIYNQISSQTKEY